MKSEEIARLLSVQQWLFREAKMLDERRYDLWLDLLDERIRYRIPSRSFVCQDNTKDFSTWTIERELEGPDALPLVDDDLAALRMRVGRLQTGMGWAEMPPSMSRRLVSNILLHGEDGREGLSVTSTLLLAKSRRDERVFFAAERRDRLLKRGDDYRLLERYVVLDDAVLPAENLSLLF